jgi:hypothetical protein
MFIFAIIIIFIISLILAFRSIRTLNEKPGIKAVKKSLDKDRVIYHSHSSS